MKKVDYSKLSEVFRNEKMLTTREIMNRLKLFYPDAKYGTLSAKLHHLKEEGLVRNVSRGIYALGSKNTFEPVISEELKRMFRRIRKQFPFIDSLCVWDTRWLNEFTVHQAFSSMILVESERDTEQAVFEYVRSKYSPVFVSPTPKEVDNYITPSRKSFVVKSLVSESPLMMLDKTSIPRLEKILVDLVSEPDLFIAFQGVELKTIFRRALSEHNTNLSTLRRYARRRGKLEEIQEFIRSYGELA